MADSLLDENKNNQEEARVAERIDQSLHCGWLAWRPDLLQRFASPKCFTFFLSLFGIVQAILSMGLTSAALPDIEKEFGLSSKQSAVILLSNDIAGIAMLPIISFYGTHARKPKWIGTGAIITGIGALLMCLPKLMAGDYNVGSGLATSTSSNLCTLDILSAQPASLPCSANKGFASSVKYLAVFAIAQFVMGAGVTPMFPLGPAYLDENMDPKMSPIHIGIFMTCNFMGPGVGYMLSSLFLSFYTDLKLPRGMSLSRKDPRWVGAWWLGFFTLSIVLLFIGAMLLCFPREMPKHRKKHLQAIKAGALPTANKKMGTGLKDILKATLNLLRNKTFMFASLGLSIKILFGAALAGFFAKVVILKFGGSISEVALYSGVVFIPSTTIGISAGSYLMKKLRVEGSAKRAALVLVISSALTCLLSTIWFLPGCNTTNLAGLTVPYSDSPFYGGAGDTVTSRCNIGCRCSQYSYQPICGKDGLTYFSACFAGCQDRLKTGFGNCSCIESGSGLMNASALPIHVDNSTSGITDEVQSFSTQAVNGRCDRKCKNLVVFLVLTAMSIAMSFFGVIPQQILTLRCVPDNQRAYALGFQLFLMRSLSLAPGPLILGSIIDANCLVWRKDKCGNRGNCLDYNVPRISKQFLIFAASATGAALVMYLLAWILHTPAETTTDQIENKAENILLTAPGQEDDIKV